MLDKSYIPLFKQDTLVLSKFILLYVNTGSAISNETHLQLYRLAKMFGTIFISYISPLR